jgi:hypothetical protein
VASADSRGANPVDQVDLLLGLTNGQPSSPQRPGVVTRASPSSRSSSKKEARDAGGKIGVDLAEEFRVLDIS